jgi:NAD+ synthase
MTTPTNDAEWRAWQQTVCQELGVAQHFCVDAEKERRIKFLADYLETNGLRTYVLGISGGVDSTTAGRLAQLSVERLRAQNYDAHFVAVRLPYGEQQDEEDAQLALNFIKPDETLVVNIEQAADGLLASLKEAGAKFISNYEEDFVLGNIKARERMIVQYAIASPRVGLVNGTDHAAESVMGFFTKFGDGGADVLPLAGLTKRRVRAMAGALGASERLSKKTPTADLETLTPQKPDEESYGISYENIDDFLEGKPVNAKVFSTIHRFYQATKHKRSLPVGANA